MKRNLINSFIHLSLHSYYGGKQANTCIYICSGQAPYILGGLSNVIPKQLEEVTGNVRGDRPKFDYF